MADETTMTPVEGAEPPKANPLAKPASSSSTLTLKPIARATTETTAAKPTLPAGVKLPPKPGLATAGLKLPPKPGLATAGLKLPPKPGFPTQSGLKLPPKPGFPTQSGLKLPPKPGTPIQSGLKLPPKPGLATAGLKLPTKPIIRKPGATGVTQTVLRPTLSGLKKPTLAGVTKPAAAASASAATVVKPVAPAPAVPTPAPTPAPAPAPSPAAPVAELTPVSPTEVKTVVAEVKPPHQTAALDALKDATQNLKSVTAPIPQQAILRKTGMLAEEKSEAQKQAAKSKTSRISLSEAMGAAPVQNENAPMKTIRIRRPIDIPTQTKSAAPAATTAPTTAAADDTQASTVAKTAATAVAETEPATEPAVTLTQRKTLKISRPSGGVVRPSGKFGIKRPGTMMTSKAAKPAADKPADAAAPKAEGDVPEVADIPSLPTDPVPTPVTSGEPDLPKAVSIIGILVQAAACVTMGALAWWLYTDTQILPF